MKNIKKFISTILVAFILNLIWELLHYSLYIDLSGISKYPHVFLASFIDAVIISFIFLIISLKDKNTTWINKPSKIDYLMIIILGLIIASLIEFWALSIGRWVYKSSMPLIFEIGLSPLLQLATTSIISLLLISDKSRH